MCPLGKYSSSDHFKKTVYRSKQDRKLQDEGKQGTLVGQHSVQKNHLSVGLQINEFPHIVFE